MCFIFFVALIHSFIYLFIYLFIYFKDEEDGADSTATGAAEKTGRTNGAMAEPVAGGET